MTPNKEPRAGSIKRMVLDSLLAGESITSLKAWESWGTSRLAALIHQLRRSGWSIESRDVVVDARHGPVTVAQYFMANSSGRGAS